MRPNYYFYCMFKTNCIKYFLLQQDLEGSKIIWGGPAPERLPVATGLGPAPVAAILMFEAFKIFQKKEITTETPRKQQKNYLHS